MSAMVSTTKADPNLTPMLDMVFQLITFFMLVINFRAASVDPSIRLPKLGSARPVANSAESDVLVLNIAADGKLNVYGQPQDAQTFLRHEAEIELAMARKYDHTLKLGSELPTTVVVRADKQTEFTKVNQILMTCQELGFRKISLKVLDQPTLPPRTHR
jgi:biopolymer transport protein ExbD